MQTDFRRALARLVPVFMPELLFRLGPDGQPLFKEFAAAIVPTEFMPGKIFGTGTMQPIDYCVALAEERIAPPANLDIATVQEQELAMAFRFHIPQYLTRRADWQARGYTETLVDFPTLNARSKFWGDDQRAAFKNWAEVTDMRNPHGQRQGVNERIMLRALLRRVDMMVLLENRLEALVRLHAVSAGQDRRRRAAGHPTESAPRVIQRSECGLDRGPDPGGLCHDRLRSALRAQSRRYTLRVGRLRHAHHHSRARVALFPGVPGRAGQGGCAPEDRLGL